MTELIVMLTHNDVTVPNALETFKECEDLPIKYWGFKDVGLEPTKMKELTEYMKSCGKETFLEVVSYSEEECMRGAKLAVECGFDYLVGTLFYDKVFEYIKTTSLKYFPFAGKVSQSPSVLQGSLEEMLDQEALFAQKGCMGTDLLGYRYIDGDPNVLAAEYIRKAKMPVCLAGSIGNEERVKKVLEMDPWTFTMGSALFTKNFVEQGSFRENLQYVVELLK